MGEKLLITNMSEDLFRSGELLTLVLEQRRVEALKGVRRGWLLPVDAIDRYSVVDFVQLGNANCDVRAEEDTLTYWATIRFAGDYGLLYYRLTDESNDPELSSPPRGEFEHGQILFTQSGVDPTTNNDLSPEGWLAPKLKALRKCVNYANAQARQHNRELQRYIIEYTAQVKAARSAAQRIQAKRDAADGPLAPNLFPRSSEALPR